MRRLVIVLSIVTILAAVFGYIVWRPVPLFIEALEAGETEDRGEGRFVTRLYDSDGKDIVHITIDVGEIVASNLDFAPVSVQIWHEDGTQLQQVGVLFTSAQHGDDFSVYLEAPRAREAPSTDYLNPATFNEGDGYSFYFLDLGYYGRYTVNYHFLVRKDVALLDITLTTELILYSTTFPDTLTQQKGTMELII